MNDITGLVITYNEAPNIARMLARLSWLTSVVVVDSGSTDDTVELARRFPNVRVVTHPFTTHAEQWTFALEQTGITSEWVLALDADFVLSDAAVQEIQTLDADADTSGFSASFRYCIDGRPLRGAVYPPVTVLYRRTSARYEQDGHAHRVRLVGGVRPLAAPIFHDDRKSLVHWLSVQVRYMRLEADKLSRSSASLGIVDRVRQLIVVAPPAMFVYSYVLRGGFLDGKAGLYYALQRMAAELLLSLYLLRRALGPEDGAG